MTYTTCFRINFVFCNTVKTWKTFSEFFLRDTVIMLYKNHVLDSLHSVSYSCCRQLVLPESLLSVSSQTARMMFSMCSLYCFLFL